MDKIERLENLIVDKLIELDTTNIAKTIAAEPESDDEKMNLDALPAIYVTFAGESDEQSGLGDCYDYKISFDITMYIKDLRHKRLAKAVLYDLIAMVRKLKHNNLGYNEIENLVPERISKIETLNNIYRCMYTFSTTINSEANIGE